MDPITGSGVAGSADGGRACNASGIRIELHDVAQTYDGPTPVHALRPTDLVVGSGEQVAIIGPSGSGKTTLLSILGLLLRPTSGCVLIDDVASDELNEAELSDFRGAHIGFVFQTFHLMSRRSVSDNVELGLMYRSGTDPDERPAMAEAALEAVGLTDRRDHLPTMLSGGERQRVAIARALVGRPGLVLADEPTGNLDSANSDRVVQLLLDLSEDSGSTLMVITHDPRVAGRFPRTIEMSDGVLVRTTGAR